ncbi:hypothetical protein [Microbispora catharanthi]|uniref:Uncharacterized protein n=1 Tax=Microbispora catharanthi TaxID=1712871 RepID=A0A5N6BZK2_9ACTN|nr:hypothetical protein [Microbispora catharanthi]KAB8185966.1 hypothetical protein FH610_009395 [Microbispora catharanthi]
MRRYRSVLPAVLVTGGYVAALVVAAVLARTGGDVGFLWRLSLFVEADEDATATWPNVLTLVLAGGLWAWALWQSLRGLPYGKTLSADPETRPLRRALYAAVAFWVFYAVMPIWPWWAVVLDTLVMSAVVVLFHPVLRRDVRHADLALAAGLLAQVSLAATEVFDVLDWHAAERATALGGFAGAGTLVWSVLVLVAQWRDGRWDRTTVWYGIASVLVPVALLIGGIPLSGTGDFHDVYDEATSAADALIVIWLARSAHELAGTPSGLAPYVPPTDRRSALTVAARFAACLVLLLPPLANRHPAWISPHVSIERLPPVVGDVVGAVSPAFWHALELFVGIGGLAVLVLVALQRRAAFWVAMSGLFLTALGGLAAVTLADRDGLGLPAGWVLTRPDDLYGMITTFSRPTTVSPLWFTAACLISAALLWCERHRRLATPAVGSNSTPSPRL